MERESILFYRSFYEVSKSLPEDEGNKFLKGLLEYAFYGIEPEFDGVSASFFMLIRPQIDANNRKFENGKKGGRPKKVETDSVNGSEDEVRPETEKTEETQINTEVIGDSKTEEKPNENQTETKTKPKENQNETKTKPNENQTESKAKPNVNVNVNDNVNYYDNENQNDNVNHSKEKQEKEKSDDFSALCVKTIEYMNEKCGTNYNPDRPEYRERIKKRIDDGYTFEDLRTVIDKKAAEWLGTPMAKHLNPHTLFSADKFDIYLHAPTPTIMKFPDKKPMMTSGIDYGAIEHELLSN